MIERGLSAVISFEPFASLAQCFAAIDPVNDGLEMSHFYGLKLNHLVFAQRFGQCA